MTKHEISVWLSLFSFLLAALGSLIMVLHQEITPIWVVITVIGLAGLIDNLIKVRISHSVTN